MTPHKTVFTTSRGQRHQEAALRVAPEQLDITMLRDPNRQTLIEKLSDAEFLISERRGVIDKDMLRSAPHLKLIQRVGALTYDIDLQAAKDAGIVVCSLPVASVMRVAEHTIMQMLVLTKKLRKVEPVALDASDKWGESKRTDEDTFSYNWSGQRNIDGLWNKTVGILGFGEIGIELARRLRGWGCTILYNKRKKLPNAVEIELDMIYGDLYTIFVQSDYIINLLPYFPETDKLIGANYFAQMKSGAYVVSTGSGSVIDEQALAKAIESGRLAGAALDTFEWEPIKPDNPLLDLAKRDYNVLLTPHTAAGTDDTNAIVAERIEIYANILKFLNGEALKHRVV